MKFKNFSTTKKLLTIMCFLIIPLTIIDVINTYLMLKPELTRPVPEGLTDFGRAIADIGMAGVKLTLDFHAILTLFVICITGLTIYLIYKNETGVYTGTLFLVLGTLLLELLACMFSFLADNFFTAIPITLLVISLIIMIVSNTRSALKNKKLKNEE